MTTIPQMCLIQRQLLVQQPIVSRRPPLDEVKTGKVLDIETGTYIKLPKTSPHTNFLTRWFSDIKKRASTDITFQPLACPYEDIVQGSEMYNTFLGYPRHLFDVNNTPTASSHKLLHDIF